jgi:hypothetical protein
MLQIKSRCTIKYNEHTDSEIIIFSFQFGPAYFLCIANTPREGEKDAAVYIKVRLDARTVVDTTTNTVEKWELSAIEGDQGGPEIQKLASSGRKSR